MAECHTFCLEVTLSSSEQHYPIHIENGALREAGFLLRGWLPSTEKVIIVTENGLDDLYGSTLARSLQDEGFQVTLVTIPGGENHKTLDNAHYLFETCLSHQLTRNDGLIALGGGIMGDLVGFVAGTYRRGIPFIQCPTSLLAQVDASVGGKVAVNFGHFKNTVGLFHHPRAVIIDPLTLSTLPGRELACGMAEIIKTALIQESVPNGATRPSLLKQLLSGPLLTPETLPPVIASCCQLKAWVVEADPEETLGIREILNLGHTLGHAVEHVSKGQVLHGEAVAIGLCAITRLAIQSGFLSEENRLTVEGLCQRYNLPTHVPSEYSASDLLSAMGQDKKRLSHDTHRLVVPTHDLGQVDIVTRTLSESELASIL